MDKAPDAFRTISEVAEVLDTPAHVLRFWESRFPQIKPVKRAGGRRYYRPADVALLSGIRQLLHAEGMTIRGVQKVLREQGVRHVAALGGEFAIEAKAQGEHLNGEDPDGVSEILAEVIPPTAEVHEMPRRPVDSDSATSSAAAAPATIEPLFPPPPPTGPQDAGRMLFDAAPAPRPDGAIPREGEGGFIAFTPPRRTSGRGRSTGADDLFQPTLPFEPARPAPPEDMPDEVPEAPHLWVDVEDDVPPVAELHSFALSDHPGAATQTSGEAATESLAPVYPAPTAATASLTATNDMPADHPAADLLGAEQSPAEPEHRPESGTILSQDAPGAQADISAEPLAAPEVAPEVTVPPLAGMAARLRGLGPVSDAARANLAELHSRLGLLHAQMAEAVRLRR